VAGGGGRGTERVEVLRGEPADARDDVLWADGPAEENVRVFLPEPPLRPAGDPHHRRLLDAVREDPGVRAGGRGGEEAGEGDGEREAPGAVRVHRPPVQRHQDQVCAAPGGRLLRPPQRPPHRARHPRPPVGRGQRREGLPGLLRQAALPPLLPLRAPHHSFQHRLLH
jgi:hypothetical protein